MTDRETDGQNYDPQNRASIAASRGENDRKRLKALMEVAQYDYR